MNASKIVNACAKPFGALLVAVSLIGTAAAQGPGTSHHKAAIRLMEAAKAGAMLAQAQGQIDQMIGQQLADIGAAVPPGKEQEFQNYELKVKGLVRKNLNWERMRSNMAELYTASYTESEIRDLTDFYRSALGQKFLTNTPQIMNQTMGMMQQEMRNLMPQVQELTVELRNQVGQLQRK